MPSHDRGKPDRVTTSSAGPRLYSDLAYLWPALSPVEHYLAEAAVLRRILRDYLGRRSRPIELLELGAGGGHAIHHLRSECRILAVDRSAAMLENCQRLNPDVECLVGDMRTLRIARRFDAVFIHDAIDYLTTPEDALATFETAHHHLEPGGLLIAAPTYLADDFVDGDSTHDSGETDELDIEFLSYVHDPEPSDTTFEMVLVYLLRDRTTRRVEVIEDRHVCGLFASETWLEWLARSGFAAEPWVAPDDIEGYEPPTWSVFVGRKL